MFNRNKTENIFIRPYKIKEIGSFVKLEFMEFFSILTK